MIESDTLIGEMSPLRRLAHGREFAPDVLCAAGHSAAAAKKPARPQRKSA